PHGPAAAVATVPRGREPALRHDVGPRARRADQRPPAERRPAAAARRRARLGGAAGPAPSGAAGRAGDAGAAVRVPTAAAGGRRGAGDPVTGCAAGVVHAVLGVIYYLTSPTTRHNVPVCPTPETPSCSRACCRCSSSACWGRPSPTATSW